MSASPSSCEAREVRQFDFWVGNWNAFDTGPVTPVARVRVDRILDGCVLREDYQDTNGLRGQSFGVYDAGNKRWHQTWVTNRGQLLLLDGDLQGEEMILRGKDRTADGKERSVRRHLEADQGRCARNSHQVDGRWQDMGAMVRHSVQTT